MRKDFGHAPSWIETPLADPLPPDSPVLARWSAVRSLLPPLSDLLEVEIVLMDADGACVGGTGPYLRGEGLRLPDDNALTYSLRSGQSTMVLTPGKDEICRSCSGRGTCADMANFTGPAIIDGKVVGVVQIVAFTDDQRAELLVKAERAFELITQVIGFAWARGRKAETPPEPPHADRFPRIVGESEAMRELRRAILKAAATSATVLIQGESGTGKELVAQAVHTNSDRRDGPFVAINCGAIPESLMESELFGYEPGAFSGATAAGRVGLLEQAHGGTFFLDEVSEMPVPLQIKLQRVLHERVVRRIGGKPDHAVDIPVIAASNRNLRELVGQGRFREDLFFRLDVIPLSVPPLRERGGDVRLLVAHFLQAFSRERGRTYRVATDLMHAFEAYPWPGNVRELKNFVEYGVGFCENDVLTLDMMASRFKAASEQPRPEKRPPAQRPAAAERERILRLLELHGRHTEGKKCAAADLGISLATLYRRMAQLGIAFRKEPWSR